MSDYIVKIVTDKEKLSNRCDEIDMFDKGIYQRAHSCIKEMKKILKAKEDLVAICANQLGYRERIFCLKFSDGEIKTFVNPMITKIEGVHLTIETNPSIPGKEYMIFRPERILIGYQTAEGKIEADMEFKYPLSAIVDQQVNMLDGILIASYEFQGLPIEDAYYSAPEEEKEELHEWYKNTFLPEKRKLLEKMASEDAEVTKMMDAVKFLTKLANKEVTLEKAENPTSTKESGNK